MQMAPEDPDDFDSTNRTLIAGLEDWATVRGEPVQLDLADLILSYRHETVDGRLNFWTPRIVEDLLRRWLPRYAVLPVSELAGAPATLRSLLRFLAETGLADPRGGSLDANSAAIDDAADDFAEAIEDPRNYALSKRVAIAAEANGAEANGAEAGPEQLQALSLAALGDESDSPEEAMRFLGEMFEQGPERAAPMLPVRLASEDDIEGTAERSPVLRRWQALWRWLGQDGAELGADGELRPADARDLAAAMELEDAGDGAEAASHAILMVQWAKAARLVRSSKGRLLPVAKAARLLSDPLTLWRCAYDTLLEPSQQLTHTIFDPDFPSPVQSSAEMVLQDIANTLYSMPAPVPVSRLEMAYTSNIGPYDGAGHARDGDTQEAQSRRDIARILDLLTELGAVDSTHGVPDQMFSLDLDDPSIGGPAATLPEADLRSLRAKLAQPDRLVELTDLGHWAHRDRLIAAGREAPVVGELVDAPASGMLGALYDHYDPQTSEEEIDLWLEHNDAGVETLLDAVREMRFRTRALGLVRLLSTLPRQGADLAARMRADPLLAPYVLLGEADPDDPVDTNDPDDPDAGLGAGADPSEAELVVVESLLQALESMGEDDFREHILAEAGTALPDLATALSMTRHPASEHLARVRAIVTDLAGSAPEA